MVCERKTSVKFSHDETRAHRQAWRHSTKGLAVCPGKSPPGLGSYFRHPSVSFDRTDLKIVLSLPLVSHKDNQHILAYSEYNDYFRQLLIDHRLCEPIIKEKGVMHRAQLIYR